MVFSLDLSTLSELVRPRILRTLSIAREKAKRETAEETYVQIERVLCTLTYPLNRADSHPQDEARLTWEGG